MMTTARRRNNHPRLTGSLLTVLFLILLGSVDRAQAQWTTPDGSGNTHTTGSGNVGVGTGSTAPVQKLEVQIPNAVGDGIRVTDAGASGKYLYLGDGSGNSGQFGPYVLGNGNANWGLLLEGGVSTDSSSIPAVSVRGNVGNAALANSPIFTVATTSGSELFRVGATGNVGIGTTSPSNKLHVYDSGNAFSTLQSGSAAAQFSLISGASGAGNWSLGTGWSGSGATRNLYFYDNVASANRMVLDGNGNVGVGTASPGGQLSVVGSSAAGNGIETHLLNNTATGYQAFRLGTDAVSGTGGVFAFFNSSFSTSGAYAANGTYFGGYGAGGLSIGAEHASGSINFFTGGYASAYQRMTISSAGNVGIGTATPNTLYKLDVQGGKINAFGGLCINGDCKAAWADVASQWTTTSSNISYSTGNVGIGTTSPGAKLDVFSSGTSHVIAGDGCSAAAGTYGGIGLGISAFSGCTNYSLLGDGAHLYLNAPSASGVIHFRSANNGGSGNDNVTILGNGNVGIGQSTPTYKLDVSGTAHVTGDITVDGNINAKYQDVAEWVPSTHALSAGTVVILNPTKSNEVMASTSYYDTRVAGVVSERPGIALGEAGKDKALVATTGRVMVMVDASKAPIHVGDLLVTSDEEGVAMKSEPVDLGGVKLHRPGTLIGKALEPLESGKGKILVLLSLQ
jgi:hypothetical protein